MSLLNAVSLSVGVFDRFLCQTSRLCFVVRSVDTGAGETRS